MILKVTPIPLWNHEIKLVVSEKNFSSVEFVRGSAFSDLLENLNLLPEGDVMKINEAKFKILKIVAQERLLSSYHWSAVEDISEMNLKPEEAYNELKTWFIVGEIKNMR